MKGMILKDWYLTWKYYKPYFLIAVFFMALSFWTDNNIFMLSYPLMLIGMIPMGLQNMDEAYKWDVYSGSLPCTKKQAVSQKYIMGLLYTLPVTVVMLLGKILAMVLAGELQWDVLGMFAVVAWMLGFLMSAFSLPLIFKFGSEKGRIAQFVIIGIACGSFTIMGLQSEGKVPAFSGNADALIAMLTVPVLLYVLSWFLSVRFYEKREIR